jgi:bilin biosynthesis protein
MLNPETQTGQDPVLLAQAQTDALIQSVAEQISLETFDPSNQDLLTQLVESFSDARGMVRLRIAETLSEIGEPATPFLLDALAHHSNPVVRRAAAKTLTLIADPVAIPTLLHALIHDEDTVVKGSSIGALARIGEPAVPTLLDLLAAPEHSESIKGHAAWALAFIGAEAREQLYAAMSSDSLDVRCAVVGAIANLAQETQETKAIEILFTALKDPASEIRIESASALGKLSQQPTAIAHLIPVLQDLDSEVRKTAALSLMKLGDRSVIPTLQDAFDRESEANIRPVIQLAISQLEKRSQEEEE